MTRYTLSTWANSWHNSLSDWTYLAINLCLRLAISVSISSRPNQYRHSAITSIDVVRKTFMRTLFKVNSNDLILLTYLLTCHEKHRHVTTKWSGMLALRPSDRSSGDVQLLYNVAEWLEDGRELVSVNGGSVWFLGARWHCGPVSRNACLPYRADNPAAIIDRRSGILSATGDSIITAVQCPRKRAGKCAVQHADMPHLGLNLQLLIYS